MALPAIRPVSLTLTVFPFLIHGRLENIYSPFGNPLHKEASVIKTMC